jgi:hypothetical protein
VVVASGWLITKQSCWTQICSQVGFTSQVSGVVETEVWTADKQPVGWLFSRKSDWVVQVIPQHVARDKGHTGALYSLLGTQKAAADSRKERGEHMHRSCELGSGPGIWDLGYHFLLRRALGLYGGVLWSGELQGPILHMNPSPPPPPPRAQVRLGLGLGWGVVPPKFVNFVQCRVSRMQPAAKPAIRGII